MSQETINFSVDAQLLRELGERLIGKPSIALAEMVKNAYDADATFAEIVFEPEKSIGKEQKGEITVRDDGHGMTFEEFRDFWMRVGTTHKIEKEYSRYFHRRMTGSKGIGRLSAQFLARQFEMKTVPKEGNGTWLWAYIDWEDAIQVREGRKDLTSVTVVYEIRNDPLPFEHGTELQLFGLKQEWDEQSLRDLAREVWWLQPPFRKEMTSLPLSERFEIRFRGAENLFLEFQSQLDAVFNIQVATIKGIYRDGVARIAIELLDTRNQNVAETYTYEYSLHDIGDPEYRGNSPDPAKRLKKADFEIRIYKGEGKQGLGISVSDLREYLERFSGVHVYDGPFRLPYYGEFENDWLKIEADHSQRAIVSKLLPERIQNAFKDVPERLRYLPTMRRMIGKVQINTGEEPNLRITSARDRLEESEAHDDLRYVVRYALDLYAYHAAKRAMQEKARKNPTQRPSETIRRIEDVIIRHGAAIPTEARRDLTKVLKDVEKSVKQIERIEQEREQRNLAILAPLATAGISSLAIQHELRKQFGKLDEIVLELKQLSTGKPELDQKIERVIHSLEEWLMRARSTNRMFDYMTGDTIRERKRYRAKKVVESIFEQMSFMALGVSLDVSRLPDEFFLPEASFAEWGAIFQNIFSNAFNAMYREPVRILSISARMQDNRRILLVQDTGIGVDLNDAERLFEPFERGIDDDPSRRRLGYGGTGLGLTIVRLLCDKIGCIARFVPSEENFATAFSLEWEEKKRSIEK